MSDPTAPRVLALLEDVEGRALQVNLDDGATFEVALDAPEVAGLAVGEPVGPALQAALGLAAERKDIARRVFSLLDRRLYARTQLRDKLRERGHDAEAIETVLDQFERQGLVDDAHFAGAFCRDQLARKPVGPNYLRHKLRAVGIASSVAEDAIAMAIPAEAEEGLADDALRRRRFTMPADRDRALRFLWSRGFSRAAAAEAVRRAGKAAEEAAGE